MPRPTGRAHYVSFHTATQAVTLDNAEAQREKEISIHTATQAVTAKSNNILNSINYYIG